MKRLLALEKRSPFAPIMHPIVILTMCYALVIWLGALWAFVQLGESPSVFKAMLLSPVFFSLSYLKLVSLGNAVLFLSLAFMGWRFARNSARPKWQAFTALSFTGLVLVSLQVGVLKAGAAADRFDHVVLPTDAELLAQFEQKRATFERLNTMMSEDTDVPRRDARGYYTIWRFAWETAPTERAKLYSELLYELGLPGEVLGSPGELRYYYGVEAIGLEGRFKGLLYAETAPRPLLPSLDDKHSAAAPSAGYRKLAEHWFVFFETTRPVLPGTLPW